MKERLIAIALELFMKALDEGAFREFIDTLLDSLEDKVVKSDSKLDDKLVLPLCAFVRLITGTPDND